MQKRILTVARDDARELLRFLRQRLELADEQAKALILQGAVRKFESDHGLAMDGIAGPQVWSHLLKAVASSDANKDGYTYAIADESNPETLTMRSHCGADVSITSRSTGSYCASQRPA